MSRKLRITIICLIPVLALIAILFVKPVAQDPAYHHFADEREMMDIPNFWNVASNLPFLIIALFSFYFLQKRNDPFPLKVCAWSFFTGIFLTGLGSSWYHLHPDNQTLVWDRLPMTISFMSLFAFIIGECISVRGGRNLLPQLIFAGIFTVLYWNYTENRGEGDLRFYALVQFLPLIMVPMILVLFPQSKKTVWYYAAIGISYILAKISEYFDFEIFLLTGGFSGHSLKHLLAALAPLIFYLKLKDDRTRRSQLQQTDQIPNCLR